jgi:hypothetical protein
MSAEAPTVTEYGMYGFWALSSVAFVFSMYHFGAVPQELPLTENLALLAVFAALSVYLLVISYTALAAARIPAEEAQRLAALRTARKSKTDIESATAAARHHARYHAVVGAVLRANAVYCGTGAFCAGIVLRGVQSGATAFAASTVVAGAAVVLSSAAGAAPAQGSSSKRR